jgi:hypothetical protein
MAFHSMGGQRPCWGEEGWQKKIKKNTTPAIPTLSPTAVLSQKKKKHENGENCKKK